MLCRLERPENLQCLYIVSLILSFSTKDDQCLRLKFEFQTFGNQYSHSLNGALRPLDAVGMFAFAFCHVQNFMGVKISLLYLADIFSRLQLGLDIYAAPEDTLIHRPPQLALVDSSSVTENGQKK